MAKVKSQLVGSERRIITKVVNGQRRVSCSCCETECCMYPAAAFNNGDITIEDLPDEIILLGEPSGDVTLFKNDPPIDASDVVESPFLIYYGFKGLGVGIANGGGPWITQIDFGFAAGNDCLLDQVREEKEQAPSWPYIDSFADTYYFTDATTNANNIALNRISLCVWESEEWLSFANSGPSQTDYYGRAVLKYVENIKTYYSGVTWDSLNPPDKNGFVFEITEYVSGGLIGYKENPQNKPDGTYIGATTPTIGRNVVITE
jgi:hypothetical protein